MRVMRLWDAFAVVRGRREDVTVNNGDLLKVIGQDASGEQPAHTAPNYQGMTTYVLLCGSARRCLHVHSDFLSYSIALAIFSELQSNLEHRSVMCKKINVGSFHRQNILGSADRLQSQFPTAHLAW